MRTRRKVDRSVRCSRCGQRGYFKFQGAWWCDDCLDRHENVESAEYLAFERFQAYSGQPGGYEPTLEAPGGPRLTDDEKRRLVGI